VLNEVKKSCDEKDDKKRSNICVQIAKLQGNCLTCLIKIVQDKKLDMYYRRWALKIASGYKGEQLSEFIKLYCLAGKLKSELLRAYYNLGDEESNVNLALFVTGEEILNTKDFFERFMAT